MSPDALGGALGLGTAGFALVAGPLIAGSLWALDGPGNGSGAGGEELEAGDGQVAQHREADGHRDAGDERPAR